MQERVVGFAPLSVVAHTGIFHYQTSLNGGFGTPSLSTFHRLPPTLKNSRRVCLRKSAESVAAQGERSGGECVLGTVVEYEHNAHRGFRINAKHSPMGLR